VSSLADVTSALDLAPDDVLPWGPGAAKIAPHALWPAVRGTPRGRLVLVSAITPTPAGEGKTTTAIGLAQGLHHLGRRVAVALREPSIAPVLGSKGGGTGAGRARVEPRERLDLHFTGDLHAVTASHNLLAALLDDALHRGRLPELDPRRATWRRVLDVGDRSLRQIVVGLGGPGDGLPRETGFDVTASSEVMAILALARDVADLKARLGRIGLGHTATGAVVPAARLDAAGPMAALLADALLPNLVRTTEGVPALVHAGPFANVAHGCNSVLATRFALARADWVVTEAGFAFDLGGEKFLHLKAPAADVWPSAVVLVLTLKALAHHGAGDSDPLVAGLANLDAHVHGAKAFGFDPVVAINVFPDDSAADLARVEGELARRGLASARCTGVADGAAGGADLAALVVERARPHTPVRLYDPAAEVDAKLATLATQLYGADGIELSSTARSDLARLRRAGLERLPVCVAKTSASLSDDPRRVGRPVGHTLRVQALRAMPGAGHVVALCGEIRLMPGLPEVPRARSLDLDDEGRVTGW
jgi:formate--tetrahydrofolate ligase